MDGSLFLPRNKEDLKVEYDSNNYLVVNKDYDLHVNTDNPDIKVSLQTQLEHSYPRLANDALVHHFHFCHRLDFATSGLLCVAKHRRAAATASAALQQRRVTKVYVALIRGVVQTEMVDIELTIGEPSDPDEARLRVCVGSGTKQRRAHTRLLLLQTGTYDSTPACKVLLLALTGRRHQLRAHVAALGHPVVGDYTYSRGQDTRPFRMMLHAAHLRLPTTDETICVSTEDPFSQDMDDGLWRPAVSLNHFNAEGIDKLVTGAAKFSTSTPQE